MGTNENESLVWAEGLSSTILYEYVLYLCCGSFFVWVSVVEVVVVVVVEGVEENENEAPLGFPWASSLVLVFVRGGTLSR